MGVQPVPGHEQERLALSLGEPVEGFEQLLPVLYDVSGGAVMSLGLLGKERREALPAVFCASRTGDDVACGHQQPADGIVG